MPAAHHSVVVALLRVLQDEMVTAREKSRKYGATELFSILGTPLSLSTDVSVKKVLHEISSPAEL